MSALIPDPPQPPAAVVLPEPVAAPAPAPWAADHLAYFGEDATAIAAADRYQREKIQPYITSLEEGSADARELWTDLNDDPAQAVRDLVASVYANEPDVVSAYDALFNAPEPVVAPPAVAATTEDVPEWAKPLVESHQQQRDRELSEANAADYNAAKDTLRAAHPDLTDADMPLIDSWVANPSIGGDMEAAYEAFTANKQAWLAAAGIAPAAEPVLPTPPPVLGTAGVAATPPLATQYTRYNQIGDALQNYLAQQGAASNPPPIVG